jgi:hypothetical protein
VIESSLPLRSMAPGRIRPGSTGGTGQSAGRPSSCPAPGRTARSPALRIANTSARTDRRPAARRRGRGTRGSWRSRASSPVSPFITQDAAPSQEAFERLRQLPVCRPHTRLPGDHEYVPPRLQRAKETPDDLPEPTADPVPHDRPAEAAPGREPEAGPIQTVSGDSHRDERMGTPRSVALESPEVRGRAERLESSGARPGGPWRRQTVRRRRPFARRAASTRRPPVVFIRARNPCSRAR